MCLTARVLAPRGGDKGPGMLPRSQPSRGYWGGIAVSDLRPKDCCASVIRSCPRRVDLERTYPPERGSPMRDP